MNAVVIISSLSEFKEQSWRKCIEELVFFADAALQLAFITNLLDLLPCIAVVNINIARKVNRNVLTFSILIYLTNIL